MTQRTVVIWKSSWLPSSETFVLQHVLGLRRWKGTPVGLRTIAGGLAVDSLTVLGSRGAKGRVEEKVLTFLGRNKRIKNYLRTLNPDLLHIHFAAEARGVHRIASSLGLPYVITVHGNDVTRAPRMKGLKGVLYRREIRDAFRGASAVVAVSEFTAALAVEHGAPSSSVRVIPLGIPVPDLVSREVEFDLVFLGRLEPVKGVADLLHAASEAQQLLGPLRIAIAGEGSLRGMLEDLAQRLSLDVTFTGKITREDVPAFLAHGRIFVAPSRTTQDGAAEGFGLVFLEAAAQERPVVAYRNGGVPEAVEDNVTGLLVPEGDVQGLVRCIERLLGSRDEARALGRAGRRRVLREFDGTNQIQKLENLYDEIVGVDRT